MSFSMYWNEAMALGTALSVTNFSLQIVLDFLDATNTNGSKELQQDARYWLGGKRHEDVTLLGKSIRSSSRSRPAMHSCTTLLISTYIPDKCAQ